MKKALLITICLLVVPLAWAQIRGIGWGTTRAEVISQEGDDYWTIPGTTSLAYERIIFGSEALLQFQFRDGLLVSGSLDIRNDNFERVKAALTEEFGEPVSSDFVAANWETRDTKISASGRAGLIVVEYESILMAGRPLEATEEALERRAERIRDAEQF